MSRKLFEALISGNFILYFNDRLIVTNKFLREFSTPPPKPPEPKEELAEIKTELKKIEDKVAERPLTPDQCLPALKGPGLPVKAEPIVPGVTPFMQFIKDCQVPEKKATQTGFYWLNRYSIPAEKVFNKILKDGYQYDILVASTKLYYKSGGMPKAIGNYIIEGHWLGCYTDMKTSLDSGTTEKHITSKLNNREDTDGHTRYRR